MDFCIKLRANEAAKERMHMDEQFTTPLPDEGSTYHYRSGDLDSWSGWQQPTPPKKPRKKKGWSAGRVIALTLCVSLLSGALGAGGAIAFHLWQDRQDAPLPTLQADSAIHMLEGIRQEAVIDTHQIDTSRQMTPAQVYAANVQSTVGITTSVTTNYWGYQTTSAASGSGFILSSDGYILTNHHVIEDSNSITVSCYDGTSYAATLIGYDESNDIAVLKVDAQGLSPVILGNSGKMNVGDSVVAIGNPLGELTFSLTSGTVSALERQITMAGGGSMNLIQTDCAINSGNSGGALFNLYGEVVGITNAKYSSSSSGASIDNIGFAIPIDNVRGIIESIIEKGYISKPYIGVSVASVSAESQAYGLPAGAAVQVVNPDGPALMAGLQVSDIITHVSGEAIKSASELISIISASRIGEVLQLTLYRQGQTLTIDVTVGEQVQSATPQQQTQPSHGYQDFPWSYFGW